MAHHNPYANQHHTVPKLTTTFTCPPVYPPSSLAQAEIATPIPLYSNQQENPPSPNSPKSKP